MVINQILIWGYEVSPITTAMELPPTGGFRSTFWANHFSWVSARKSRTAWKLFFSSRGWDAQGSLSALQRSLPLQSGKCCGEGKNQGLLTGKKHKVAAVTILSKGGHGKGYCFSSNYSRTLKPGLLPHPSLTGQWKGSLQTEKRRGEELILLEDPSHPAPMMALYKQISAVQPTVLFSSFPTTMTTVGMALKLVGTEEAQLQVVPAFLQRH